MCFNANEQRERPFVVVVVVLKYTQPYYTYIYICTEYIFEILLLLLVSIIIIIYEERILSLSLIIILFYCTYFYYKELFLKYSHCEIHSRFEIISSTSSSFFKFQQRHLKNCVSFEIINSL